MPTETDAFWNICKGLQYTGFVKKGFPGLPAEGSDNAKKIIGALLRRVLPTASGTKVEVGTVCNGTALAVEPKAHLLTMSSLPKVVDEGEESGFFEAADFMANTSGSPAADAMPGRARQGLC